MDDLIARLESGEGADRELDADICVALSWIGTVRDNSTFNGPPLNVRRADYPSYDDEPHDELDYESADNESWTSDTPAMTTSLDAAVAFMERRLRDWSDWSISTEENGARFVARVVPMHRDDAVTGCAKSAARALVAAALRALSPTPTEGDHHGR